MRPTDKTELAYWSARLFPERTTVDLRPEEGMFRLHRATYTVEGKVRPPDGAKGMVRQNGLLATAGGSLHVLIPAANSRLDLRPGAGARPLELKTATVSPGRIWECRYKVSAPACDIEQFGLPPRNAAMTYTLAPVDPGRRNSPIRVQGELHLAHDGEGEHVTDVLLGLLPQDYRDDFYCRSTDLGRHCEFGYVFCPPAKE